MEARVFERGVEAETCVGAGDEDGLACEGDGRVGRRVFGVPAGFGQEGEIGGPVGRAWWGMRVRGEEGGGVSGDELGSGGGGGHGDDQENSQEAG